MKNKKIYLIVIAILLLCFVVEQVVFYNIEYCNKTIDSYEENSNHIEEIKKYVSIDRLSVKNEEEPTILFGSDYQGDNRYNNTNDLFKFTSKYVKPNLFVMCGDYRVTLDENYIESENGIFELAKMFRNYFGNVPMITIQGNHDLPNTLGITTKQYFTTYNYIIYNINRDEFPNNQDVEENSEEIVKNTTDTLEKFFKKQTKLKTKKPIFIVTHVPLHYTTRNNGEDNKYAYILLDVINRYSKDLDIVYLFGHNHSSTYDDYIGGSINYIGKGKTMYVGGINKEEVINFTYMNAGYIGFSNNTNNDTSTNTLTLSTIKIKKDSLEIQRYTKDKIYYDTPIIVERINKKD